MVRLENAIGDAGVRHLADMLKVNTTLTELVMDGELRLYWFDLFRVILVADVLNDCVCGDIDNQIGDDGVRDIADALKLNTTLVAIALAGINIFLFVFSFTSHPFVNRNCNQQGCCQLYRRRV